MEAANPTRLRSRFNGPDIVFETGVMTINKSLEQTKAKWCSRQACEIDQAASILSSALWSGCVARAQGRAGAGQGSLRK
jgi:hypothetical protein